MYDVLFFYSSVLSVKFLIILIYLFIHLENWIWQIYFGLSTSYAACVKCDGILPSQDLLASYAACVKCDGIVPPQDPTPYSS
jgi:hypothetical protein